MDFALTDEQRMVQQGVREVTRRFDLDSWREQDARHRFPAAEALALGMVERVVPHDRLMEEARALAMEIAGNGPLAVRALKRLVNTCYEADLASAQELARALRQPLDHTADMLEGVRAFEEKRPPRYQGR